MKTHLLAAALLLTATGGAAQTRLPNASTPRARPPLAAPIQLPGAAPWASLQAGPHALVCRGVELFADAGIAVYDRHVVFYPKHAANHPAREGLNPGECAHMDAAISEAERLKGVFYESAHPVEASFTWNGGLMWLLQTFPTRILHGLMNTSEVVVFETVTHVEGQIRSGDFHIEPVP